MVQFVETPFKIQLNMDRYSLPIPGPVSYYELLCLLLAELNYLSRY